MATAKATIYIGKTKLLPYHVHVEQRSDWHHVFEITVSTEKAGVMDKTSSTPESIIFDNAIKYSGKLAEIIIERPSGTFTFKGFVTNVQVEHTYAGDAFIIMKGFSPTYMLDGQKSVASFEEKNLKEIFNQVTKGFPENIKKIVKPKYDQPIPYVTRYKETQYQFLSRLASIYGEWFYYDGQQVVFGELPSKKKEVVLHLGSDSMLSFNYGINLRPVSFKQQFYKYDKNSLLERSVAGFEPGWLDAHSKTSHMASKEFFKEEGVHPVTQSVKDDKQINYLAETRKSSMLSDVMIFTGQSADPGITIGAEVEVHSKKGFLGKYLVISVKHDFNSSRDYNNLFEAIPISSVAPPVNRNTFMPAAESQVAVVQDNNDPDKLGRVRVQFKWQEGMTPWVRVLTNHAGMDSQQGVYGTYFIPEIGDEVYVDFEQGNPDRPYVTGSKYHSNTKPSWSDPKNNLKAIKTRSGHTLLFNDEKGKESITISDKNGNTINLDTAGGNISISTPGTLSLSCKDLKINASGNMDTTVSGDKKINVTGNMETNVTSNKDIKVTGNMSTNVTGDKKVNVTKNLNLAAKMNADIAANMNASLKAKINVSVEGGAKADLKSTAMTSVTGATVKLN